MRPARPNLQLLLSNPEHAHLVDLLQRERLEAVLEQLREYADVIIIDSPPLTEVGDALPPRGRRGHGARRRPPRP